jgi:LuxR family quorum-sensing system transcriptional regulator CciR
MSYIETLHDVATVRIAGAADISRAAQALYGIVRSRVEMRIAITHNIADRSTPVDEHGRLLAETAFPSNPSKDAWWRRANVALDSPLVAACRYEADPFWVNADGFRSKRPNQALDRIDLDDFERRALTRAAIVAPVHLPFGQIGAASLHPTDQDKTDLTREFESFADEFSFLAAVFIRSYAKCVCVPKEIPAWVKLTKRELQCIHWVSLGKTDDEISVILNRSRATVRFHLHNAAVKFGAVNRSQLLLRAGQLGYISHQQR